MEKILKSATSLTRLVLWYIDTNPSHNNTDYWFMVNEDTARLIRYKIPSIWR